MNTQDKFDATTTEIDPNEWTEAERAWMAAARERATTRNLRERGAPMSCSECGSCCVSCCACHAAGFDAGRTEANHTRIRAAELEASVELLERELAAMTSARDDACREAANGYSRGWGSLDKRDAMARIECLQQVGTEHR